MERRPINKWLIALTVMLPTIMEIMDTTIVNVSLPHIQGGLSVGVDEVTWVLTSYLVSNAIIIPITGWLASVFGRKRYLIFCITFFTLSSFMCGSANTLGMLVFFRVIQGLAGGGLQPISQAILLETFPKEEHGMAMAAWGTGIVFAPILGPVLGGWITENWSWPWIFYINIPIGTISIVLTMLFIFDPPYLKRKFLSIDYIGLVLLAVGIGCLQIVLDKGQRKDWFSSHFIVSLSIIAAISLILLVIRELLYKEPVINLRVFKDRSYATGTFVIFLYFFCFFGSVVLLPLYVQKLMGYTAFLAGLVLAPGATASLLFFPLVGKLAQKLDNRYLLGIGLSIAAYSIYLMSQFNLSAGFWNIVWPRALQGVGMAFLLVPLTVVTFVGIKKEDMGNATSIFNLLRNLGSSFGIAFITTVLERRAQFHQTQLVTHLTPTDIPFQHACETLKHLLPEDMVLGSIYNELLRQALMLSFNDAFYILSIFVLCLLPSLLIFKRIKRASHA